MNCEQYNDIVAADVDGVLRGEEKHSAAEHVAACPGCRTARRDQQITKTILRERVARHAVPDDLRHRVLASVDANRDASNVEPRRQSSIRRRVLVGTIAALFALALYSLLSPSQPDLVAVVVADVNAVEEGALELGLQTNNIEELQSYFESSGRIDFEKSAGDFSSKGFRLVGGSVSDIGAAPSTLSVYDSAHGKVICRRVRDGRVEIPALGEEIGDRRIFTVDGVTFGITRLDGGVLCILASKMPRETFVEHLEGRTHANAVIGVPASQPLL